MVHYDKKEKGEQVIAFRANTSNGIHHKNSHFKKMYFKALHKKYTFFPIFNY